MTALPEAVEIKVGAAADIAGSADRARQLAELIGFTRGECEEIVLLQSFGKAEGDATVLVAKNSVS